MDSYLLDRETLGKFVDELLAEKFPGRNPVELSELRKTNIKALDDRIGNEIIGSLNDEQTEEFNSILERDDDDPDAFRVFFKNAGIDVEAKISEILQDFASNFLAEGGENV